MAGISIHSEGRPEKISPMQKMSWDQDLGVTGRLTEDDYYYVADVGTQTEAQVRAELDPLVGYTLTYIA